VEFTPAAKSLERIFFQKKRLHLLEQTISPHLELTKNNLDRVIWIIIFTCFKKGRESILAARARNCE